MLLSYYQYVVGSFDFRTYFGILEKCIAQTQYISIELAFYSVNSLSIAPSGLPNLFPGGTGA